LIYNNLLCIMLESNIDYVTVWLSYFGLYKHCKI